jgi:hypothetical protein
MDLLLWREKEKQMSRGNDETQTAWKDYNTTEAGTGHQIAHRLNSWMVAMAVGGVRT